MERAKILSEFKEPLLNKYAIVKKLKKGGFASVYLAEDIQSRGRKYAVKMIPNKHHKYTQIQIKMYEQIKENNYTHGFVRQYEAGKHGHNSFLVMELLGEDLQQLTLKGRKLSVKSALMVGLQAIDRIEALHKIGYLHRDIKPDNLAIGMGQKSKVIHLIDFGLSKAINEEQSKDEINKAVGTLGYMSINAHLGKLQTKSDDLQSLVYTVIYLMMGTLPWMKLKLKDVRDYHKIKVMKEMLEKELPPSAMQRIPSQVFDVLSYIRSLKKSQTPDYLKIKFKFLDALKDLKQQNDFLFDWIVKDFTLLHKAYDSNRQLIEMKQHNQKFVEGQIYEVYKFIEQEKPKRKSRSKSKQKRNQQKQQIKQAAQSNGPAKKNKEEQEQNQRILQRQKKQLKNFLMHYNDPNKVLKVESKPVAVVERPISVNKAIEVNKNARPISAHKPKKQPLSNPWKDNMQKVIDMHFEAPRIVINKTAKHKI